MCVCVCIQAREKAVLRDTLLAEREAAGAELEALRATIQKLESQKHETHQLLPVISDKEVEERRRAEEKAAQKISLLTEVQKTSKHLDVTRFKVLSVMKHFFLHFKEVQALRREKDSLSKETEELSDRVLQQEKMQEGRFIGVVLLFAIFLPLCISHTLFSSCVCVCVSRTSASGCVSGECSSQSGAG